MFATCQLGAEPLLIAEVARLRPKLRPAFRRPGLVTWVSDAEVAPEVTLDAVFARVWGASLGRDGVLPGGAIVHEFPRDPEAGEVKGEPARLNELVCDQITAPGEPTFVGVHRHTRGRWAIPGGLPQIVVPPESPSRAFAKIEEAIAWAGLDVREGQTAVEIGSAPGGAALALALRGVTVWGVDPGEMKVAHPLIHHLDRTISALRWEELPPRVDWLLMDVNLAPQLALHELARLAPPLRGKLRGAVLTLKLNDARVVEELPSLLARAGTLGLGSARATHLPSNRREVCCVLTP